MLNQVILIGRLVKKPELKESDKKVNYIKETLAVQSDFKNKDGNYHISEDGKITQVQFADLDAYLKSVKEATVSADKNLKYQTIMDVITKIKENGVDNLGLTFYE